MAPKIADVADFDGQVIARLPLNIERLVNGVGEFVRRDCSRQRRRAVRQLLDGRRRWAGIDEWLGLPVGGGPQRCAPGIREIRWL